MMNWALNIFDKVLGPALIILGITILLGVANRVSLIILGLIYVGLTWGLILIKQDSGVAWLGIHVVMVAMALNWANHNRLCILNESTERHLFCNGTATTENDENIIVTNNRKLVNSFQSKFDELWERLG